MAFEVGVRSEQRKRQRGPDKDDDESIAAAGGRSVTAVPGSAAHRAVADLPEADPSAVRRHATEQHPNADALTVRRSPAADQPTIRRFMDPAEFGKGTDMGAVENQKNSYRQAILVLLEKYRNLTPPGGSGVPDTKVDEAITLVGFMAKTAQGYLQNAGPTRDRAGFEALLQRAQAQAADLKQRKATLAKAPPKKTAAPAGAAPTGMPRQHLPGDPNPLFSKVGSGVGLVVPKNGDKGSFSIELTFPTPSGVNVKGSMLVNAERANDRLKARARIMVGAAVGVAGIAEISAAVGGYLEAEAQDPTSLGALLERALYDRVSATPGMPDMVVGYLFGSGGSGAGAKAAKDRMGAIGDRHLKGENYYESGVELEGKAEAKEAASVTGGFTAGTRRDSAKGPAKNAYGINRAIKIEQPLEAELQMQAKIGGEPGKSMTLIGGELAAELVLNHDALTKLQSSADTAMVVALVFSAVNKGIATITALSNAKETPPGLTASRLTTGVLGAQAQLVGELMKLKKGLPPPETPGGPAKKLSLKSAVGLGLKLDLATGKVSVVLRRFTDVDINVGAMAVKGSKSSEASFDFGGTPPPKK